MLPVLLAALDRKTVTWVELTVDLLSLCLEAE